MSDRPGVLAKSVIYDEAHFPTQHSSPEAQARVPSPDEDARRQVNIESSAGQGPRQAVRLTEPVAAMPVVRILRSSRDFHRVRSTGAHARSNGITVWVVEGSPGAPPRLGLAARSRSAVERNRIRRRVRAAWREAGVEQGRDVVVGADRAALAPPFQELVNHIRSALTRAESRS